MSEEKMEKEGLPAAEPAPEEMTLQTLWTEYARPVLVWVLVAAVLVLGWSAWRNHRENLAAEESAALFQANTAEDLRNLALAARNPATAAAAFALDEFDRDDPIAKKAVAFLAPCTVLWTAWEDSQPWTAGDAPVRDWFFVTCAKYGTNPDFPDWNKWFFPAFLQRQTIVKAAESGYEDAEGKPRDVAWWDSPSAEERGVCSGGPVLPCKRWRGGESFDGETTLGDRVRDTCLCALSLMVYYSDPSAASHFEEEVSFLRPKKSDDIPVSVHRKTERQGSDARVIQTPHPAEPEPHAQAADWRPTPEQTGRFRFDDKGKVVVAEVDAEGRVRLLENEPDSPPLRIRPATIRNRDLFVVEMDDIPDTGRHWSLALEFDASERAWIVVGEGESIADIIPGKPGYRNATFHREDPPAPDPAANAPDPSRLPDEFVLVPAAVDSYTAVPPPPGLVPNWLYAVGIDHRKCFELVCTDREKKHFCTLGTRASIYSSFKLEWLDADTLLYTSGDIGTWAVFPTEEGRWNIRAATVRRNDSGAVESFELDYWLYPTNFTPQWPAIPALPATPSPAEKTHAESAEPAEPESHAEGAE